jgi:hypothetical protein
MAPHKEADCVDCRINRRIRELAKEFGGSHTHLQDLAELRRFGREVARQVKKELRRIDDTD